MVVNIIGDCDKRPVLYTMIKICQTLGDVLVISNNSRIMRLSDTGTAEGHYQNTMIAYTDEGIDDFFETFPYNISDFEYIIIDNIISADSDLTIYCKGMLPTENETDNLEYIDDYVTIELYNGKYTDSNTMLRLEEFEAYTDMCPINSKIIETLATKTAKYFKLTPKSLNAIASTPPVGPTPKARNMAVKPSKKKGK